MKTLPLLCCCFAALSLQTDIPSFGAESDLGYSVVDRGPHHRVVQAITQETNDISETSIRTNSYVELATGMHYEENGQWLESREEIELLPNGRGAAALHGAHKVFFPTDIAEDGSS